MPEGADLAVLADRMRQAVVGLVGDDDAARYGLAVSGGPDSMAMLALSATAFPERIACATIDHGLRAESGAEAAMVARWCVDRGIPHALLHPDAAVEGNVQAWARGQRYRLLEGWREAEGLDWILTAHHADDQIETMLMRLNRGAGLSGLAGIRARAGRVLRPLLALRKQALVDLARTLTLPFVEDPSNRDPRFDRAALRVALAGADWLDPLAAAHSAAALAEAEAALAWTVEGLAEAHIRADGEAWTLDRTDLPRELLRRLVMTMLERVDSASSPPRGASLDHAIAAARTGAQASLGNCLLVGGAIWTVMPMPSRRT